MNLESLFIFSIVCAVLYCVCMVMVLILQFQDRSFDKWWKNRGDFEKKAFGKQLIIGDDLEIDQRGFPKCKLITGEVKYRNVPPSKD